MFKRANWAVIGIKPESKFDFSLGLTNKTKLLELSQFSASTTSKFHQYDTVGINAFASPRRDEEQFSSLEGEERTTSLDAYLQSSDEDKEKIDFPNSDYTEVMNLDAGDYDLQLTGQAIYAFWAVFNKWGDITDLNSKKEGISYDIMDRPYALLTTEEKKNVDVKVMAQNAIQRRQYPVIVDFDGGRAYIGTSNPKEIEQIQFILTKLAVETFGLHWDFGPDSQWYAKFLKFITNNTRYQQEFKDRAEEATRFKKNEIVKLEDKGLEKIVSSFFSLAELPSSLWAGLGAPAVIKLHVSSDPINVSSVTNATTLLNVGTEAYVNAAPVVLQELQTIFTKAGEEKIYRTDVVRFDMNDAPNLLDQGAAILKGFDLPKFKKDILTAIKKDRLTFEVPYFWQQWLIEMRHGIASITESITDALELPRGEYGLQPFEAEPEGDAQVVPAAA